VTWLGLIRYHVLFAIDIASRKVEIVGMAVHPLDGADGAQPSRCGRWLPVRQAVCPDRSGSSVRGNIPPNPWAGWGEGGEAAGEEPESERLRPPRPRTALERSAVGDGSAAFSASTTARLREVAQITVGEGWSGFGTRRARMLADRRQAYLCSRCPISEAAESSGEPRRTRYLPGTVTGFGKLPLRKSSEYTPSDSSK
jgi:hypothetical protein